ncbi:hypothetical protein ACHAPJ_003296 [Fusarium lateritium]
MAFDALEGINNLDAILTKVPDIDIVWLGSLDARISMNLPGNHGLGGAEQEWLDAREKFFSVLDKHNKPYGGFAFANPPYGTPEGLQKAAERMSFILMTADVIHLAAMGQDLQQARELIASASSEANGGNGPN